MENSCSELKTRIEKILKNRSLLDDFDRGQGFSLRIKQSGILDFVVERSGDNVFVGHYFNQGEDPIPDPGIEICIDERGSWYLVAIQFATGHRSIVCGENMVVDVEEIEKQTRFSSFWAKSLDLIEC